MGTGFPDLWFLKGVGDSLLLRPHWAVTLEIREGWRQAPSAHLHSLLSRLRLHSGLRIINLGHL